MFDLKSKKIVANFKGHKDNVLSLAINRSGKYLISGSEDNTIKLWSLKKKKLIKTFRGHRSSINSLLFTKNSKFIVSASGSFMVREIIQLKFGVLKRETYCYTKRT